MESLPQQTDVRPLGTHPPTHGSHVFHSFIGARTWLKRILVSVAGNGLPWSIVSVLFRLFRLRSL